MVAPTSLLSTWELVADDYLVDIVPSFEAFADVALEATGIEDRLEDGIQDGTVEVADIASGPGTFALKAAARGARVSALDFSPKMIAHLQTRAASMSLVVDAVVGDGQALPWGDRRFDAAVSLFGLVFFADREAGFNELYRVLRAGGRAVVSSWVPTSQVAIINDAVTTLMAAAKAPPMPPTPPPLSSPELLRAELEAAGFADVSVEERSVLVPFASTTALLEWMVRSVAPIVLMKKHMGEAAFAAVFQRWQVSMIEIHGAGPVQYPLVALLGTGTRP